MHVTTWIGGAFVFGATLGRVPSSLPMPPPREIWEAEHAGSRPSRACWVCVGVQWEGFYTSESV